MNNKTLVLWLNELIAEDRLSEFYTSRPWRRVRGLAFERDHYECQECRRNGRLTLLVKPMQQARPGEVQGIGHHKKPLRLHPELALDVSNIESLCWACHNKIEKTNEANELTEEFW